MVVVENFSNQTTFDLDICELFKSNLHSTLNFKPTIILKSSVI